MDHLGNAKVTRMDIVHVEYYETCGETQKQIKELLTRRILAARDVPGALGELFESTTYNRNGEPTATALCFVPMKVG